MIDQKILKKKLANYTFKEFLALQSINNILDTDTIADTRRTLGRAYRLLIKISKVVPDDLPLMVLSLHFYDPDDETDEEID